MIRKKPSVVVLTGAGISADSGLATFRGPGGLWEDLPVEELATPEAWARDPDRVWRFYQARRAQLAAVEPNAAHVALARLERELVRAGTTFTLITQNVDDLHQRAGSTPIAMHGELARLRCTACGASHEDRAHVDPDVFVACPACGHSPLRPDVVWFGEIPLHMDAIGDALLPARQFVVIGTSGAVYPAAAFLEVARAAGAETWVNCLEEPDNLHPDDHFLPGRAADVIPAQVERWLEAWAPPGAVE